jgi:hypothetical protein
MSDWSERAESNHRSSRRSSQPFSRPNESFHESTHDAALLRLVPFSGSTSLQTANGFLCYVTVCILSSWSQTRISQGPDWDDSDLKWALRPSKRRNTGKCDSIRPELLQQMVWGRHRSSRPSLPPSNLPWRFENRETHPRDMTLQFPRVMSFVAREGGGQDCNRTTQLFPRLVHDSHHELREIAPWYPLCGGKHSSSEFLSAVSGDNFNLTSVNIDLNFPDIKYKSSLFLTEYQLLRRNFSYTVCNSL